MDHAINGLRDYIKATVEIALDNPDDKEIRKDILSMMKAIHIMERRHYGKEITSLSEISREIK